jgi:hypothetical protein
VRGRGWIFFNENYFFPSHLTFDSVTFAEGHSNEFWKEQSMDETEEVNARTANDSWSYGNSILI